MVEWIEIKGKKYLKFRCLNCKKEWMLPESDFDFLTGEQGLNMEIEDLLYCDLHWTPRRRVLKL